MGYLNGLLLISFIIIFVWIKNARGEERDKNSDYSKINLLGFLYHSPNGPLLLYKYEKYEINKQNYI